MMKTKCQLVVLLMAVCCPVILHAQATREVGGGGGSPATTAITTGVGIKNGKVWIWGFRGSGQQGNGQQSESFKNPPTQVESLNNIVFVTGGAYHLLAVDGNGRLYGWGQNGYGETGCGAKAYINTPCQVSMPYPVQQVAAGEYHSIALDSVGDVYTWGFGTLGRLGHGSSAANIKTPKKVNLNGERARLVGGAYEGSFVVTHEGNVWAWGDNEFFGLGVDYNKVSGTRWIYNPMKVANLKPYAEDIVAIGGGNGWGEALLKDGTIIGWGWHASIGQTACDARVQSNVKSANPVRVAIIDYVPGAQGKLVPVEKKVTQLLMRYVGSIALTADNQIYTWGQTDGSAFKNVYGYCPTKRETVPGRIIRIGTAKESVTYELENGAIYGVGYNSLGGLNNNHTSENVKDWPGIRLKDLP